MNHFNWKQYISNYSDLQAAGINTSQKAWVHYNLHGKNENRTDISKEDDLTLYLNKINFKYQGGHIQQTDVQINKIINLLNEINPKNIMEIGFNAGHSSEIFLKNTNANVVSFDIVSDCFPYTMYGKGYLDYNFPNRHILIKGDSTLTIPEYKPEFLFDIIFIDGCHDYSVVKQDLLNCKRLGHSDSIVIVDDTVYEKEWIKDYTIGPTKAWEEMVKNKEIEELGCLDIIPGKGMSWGKYIYLK